MTRSPALWLVFAAIAVNGPRLVLAFLAADRVGLSPASRQTLLEVTAIATALVLTGGAAYLAHAASSRRRYRRLLTAAWVLVLASSGALIAPLLVGALAGQELHQVLAQPWQRTAWSVLAVLAVEVVAGGAMVAHAAGARDRDELADLEAELDRVARERNRLAQRVLELEQPGSAPGARLSRPQPGSPAAPPAKLISRHS